MERFQELKTKGWVNLTKDEKAEYQGLKGSSSKVVSQEETITVKKGDLHKMIDEAVEAQTAHLQNQTNHLERQIGLGDWQDIESKERKHTAHFKLYRTNTDEDFRLIVDWKHLRFDYDEETRKHDKNIYKITLIDDKGEESLAEIELTAFARIQDLEVVDIIEQEKKKQVKTTGKVRRAPTKSGYVLSSGVGLAGLSIPEGGGYVDQTVVQDKITCTVKRKSGQIFIVDHSRLNA